MEHAQQIIVMTREELIALIEEVIIRLRKMDNPAYNSRQSEGATTKVFTRIEVAKILYCTPNTITKYINQNKLHASVFNRQYRINEKELIRFINQKTK